MTTALSQFSDALTGLIADVAPRAAVVHLRHGRHLTGIRWQDDLVIVSEQALPKRDRFPVVFQDSSEAEGEVLGRDEGTNVALIKVAGIKVAGAPESGVAQVGAVAVAVGARRDGLATARLGVVNQVGPEWQSSHGGRIDAYVRLDISLSHSEEGGPALDSQGKILGMTTFGPRGQVLVIPHATLARVIPVLLASGKVARGWLGAALQPVAVPSLPVENAAEYGRGLMVMAVTADSPAAVGGLVSGDIILAVDDQAAGHMTSLARRLGSESLGSVLRLKLLRGGTIIVLDVTVTERPAG